MMLWLKRVIARLLGTQIQPMDNLAQPMQTAGHVSKELTTQVGNKHSAQTPTQLQSQSPAQPRSPRKPRAVKSITAESKDTSKKRKPAQTGKSRTTAGSSTPTRASKTRQHVK
jgi:cell division septation protein DedD